MKKYFKLFLIVASLVLTVSVVAFFKVDKSAIKSDVANSENLYVAQTYPPPPNDPYYSQQPHQTQSSEDMKNICEQNGKYWDENMKYCDPNRTKEGCNIQTQKWCTDTNSCMSMNDFCGQTNTPQTTITEPLLSEEEMRADCEQEGKYWNTTTKQCDASKTKEGCNVQTQKWCGVTNMCIPTNNICGQTSSQTTQPSPSETELKTRCEQEGKYWNTTTKQCDASKTKEGCNVQTEKWCGVTNMCIPTNNICGQTSSPQTTQPSPSETEMKTRCEQEGKYWNTTTKQCDASKTKEGCNIQTQKWCAISNMCISVNNTCGNSSTTTPPNTTQPGTTQNTNKSGTTQNSPACEEGKYFCQETQSCLLLNDICEISESDTSGSITQINCVPEKEFYCPAQNKCLATGEICENNPNKDFNNQLLAQKRICEQHGGKWNGYKCFQPEVKPGQDQETICTDFACREDLPDMTNIPSKELNNRTSNNTPKTDQNKSNQHYEEKNRIIEDYFKPRYPTYNYSDKPEYSAYQNSRDEMLKKEQELKNKLNFACEGQNCGYLKYIQPEKQPVLPSDVPTSEEETENRIKNYESVNIKSETYKTEQGDIDWTKRKDTMTEYWKNISETDQKKNHEEVSSQIMDKIINYQTQLLPGNEEESGDETVLDIIAEQLNETLERLAAVLEEREKKIKELESQITKIEEKTVEMRQKLEEKIAEKQEERKEIISREINPVMEKKMEKMSKTIDPGFKEKIIRLEEKEEQEILMRIDPEKVKLKQKLIENIVEDFELKGNFISGKIYAGNIPALAALAGTVQEKTEEDKNIIQEDMDIFAHLDTSTTSIGSIFVVKNESGLNGKDVTIAVIDSGIDESHPSLKDKIIESVNFSGESDVLDYNGHGTHVANIIVGGDELYGGVAPGAKILNVKVMNKDGSGKMSNAIAGIEWAVEKKADIINISLGAPLDECDGTDALSSAVEDAIAAGVTVVTAAGNFGPDENTIAAPGCSINAITVGAVDNSGNIANFSSRGPTADGRVKPDILAPGVSITSAWMGEEFAGLSGTSQASPHVAGVAALLLQADSKLTPQQLKQVLMATADPVDTDEETENTFGIVNAYTAVSQYVALKELIVEQDSETEEDSDREEEKSSSSGASSEGKKVYTEEAEIETFEEARNGYKNCVISAGIEQAKKEICLNDFLKNQVKVQKRNLSESEKEKSNELEQKAVELNKLAKTMSGDNSSELKTMASVLYYSVFIGDSLEILVEKLEDFIQSASLEVDLEDNINELKEIYFKEKEKSENEKFNRELIPFKDVGDRLWYFSYVKDIKDKKIISGYKDESGNSLGLYGPGDNLTIAESLKIVLEASKHGQSTAFSEPQTQGASSHWAKQYILKAEELDLSVLKGLDDLNRPITRKEVVQMIIEAFDMVETTIFDAIFSDVPQTHPQALYIYSAYNLGIISGDSGKNTFRPDDPLNRAEMAKITVEALEL